MDIPVYNAIINEMDGDGIYAISLVSSPAVERDFIAFDKDKKPEFKFEVVNDVQHMITGVVMLADTPIYRYSPDMGEYYIKFDKETIKLMAEKMLQYGSHNTIDLQHDENYFYGKCNLVECYIKDSEKGVVHSNFSDIPDGSLIATYKVHDVELWDKIVAGEVKGFSLEGFFNIKEEQFNNKDKKNNTIMSKIKDALKRILAEMGTITTKDGKELEYDAEELAVDVAVNVEDGEYELEDGKVIVVTDGKVAEIKDAPVEDEKPEETNEEEKPEEKEDEEEEEMKKQKCEDEEVVEPVQETPSEVESLKAEIDALKADMEALKAKIEEIVNAPVAEPVAEEFEKVKNDKKLSKAAQIASFLNK